jgi:membrane protein YdbS with pleckstrin-like domain
VSEPDEVADSLDHVLDPRVIPLQRMAGGLFMVVVLLVALVVMAIVLVVGDDLTRWQRLLLPVAWVVLAALGAWFAYRWPEVHYRHTSYRVDGQGIEIRRGAFWRVVINVPKSRVQHIDVSQGPIERRHGLGTLVVYTAGTDHAKVELAGLEHGRALRIRAHLLPSGAGDAV